MIRKITAVLLTTTLLAVGIGSASADGSGSCSISGGTVSAHVNEDPAEGDVSYISIASPVRLDDSTASDKTRARFFYEYGYQYEVFTNPKYAYSSPVDGDGYWNYRIDVYYRAYGYTELYIGHVHLNIEKYGSTSECYMDVYI